MENATLPIRKVTNVAALACGLVLLAGAVSSSASAQVCFDFDSQPPGSRVMPWAVLALGSSGTTPPVAGLQFTASGGIGMGYEVVSPGAPNGSPAVLLDGSLSTVHRLDIFVEEKCPAELPEEVEVLVAPLRGDVTVEAYDAAGSLVDTGVAPYNVTTSVLLHASEIAYLHFLGSGYEAQIDDVCVQ